MAEFQLLNTTDFVTTLEKEAIINFLLENLDDYTESRDNVSRAIEYALSKFPHQGGFILMAKNGNEIQGVAVVNRTNFEEYFPENILVFIATSRDERRKGIALELLNRTKVYSKGSILVRITKDGQINQLFTKAGFELQSTEYILNR